MSPPPSFRPVTISLCIGGNIIIICEKIVCDTTEWPNKIAARKKCLVSISSGTSGRKECVHIIFYTAVWRYSNKNDFLTSIQAKTHKNGTELNFFLAEVPRNRKCKKIQNDQKKILCGCMHEMNSQKANFMQLLTLYVD